MNIKYFDHAATTAVAPEVLHEMIPYFSKNYGNASSMYEIARISKRAMNEARAKIAHAIGASPKEIYFTSCGSESDNLAIKGIAYANKEKGKHIITSKIEHNAVLNSCERLEEQGFEITYLNVDQNGFVNLEELKNAIREDTILITIMFANNEVGTIEPVEKIAEIAKNNNIIFHTDAVQAIGNVRIDVKKMGIDMLSVSGHKIHGPKGVGFLYIKKGLKVKPFIYGGGHERGQRSGTENVPSIVGLAEAIRVSADESAAAKENVMAIKKYLAEGILREIPKTHINGPSVEEASPYVLNVSFNGLRSEVLLHALEEKEIYVSAGSACSSKKKGSSVLSAMGLSDVRIEGAIRFSFSRYNTVEEAEECLRILKEKTAFLRKYMR